MPQLAYLWDYDLSETEFRALLRGQTRIGRLDQDWAAVRLLEYASFEDIVRLLGYRRIVEGWPRWRAHIRSVSRKRGLDFLVAWLPQQHPELL